MVMVMTMIMLMIMVMIMVMIFYDYGYDSYDISLWSSFPWESKSGSLNPSWRQPKKWWEKLYNLFSTSSCWGIFNIVVEECEATPTVTQKMVISNCFLMVIPNHLTSPKIIPSQCFTSVFLGGLLGLPYLLTSKRTKQKNLGKKSSAILSGWWFQPTPLKNMNQLR